VAATELEHNNKQVLLEEVYSIDVKKRFYVFYSGPFFLFFQRFYF